MFNLKSLKHRSIKTGIFNFKKCFISNVIDSTAASKLDLNNTIFVDVRPEDAFKQGHIKGSVNIHSIFTYLFESKNNGLQKLIDHFQETLQSKGVNGKENLVFYESNLGALKGASCRGFYLMDLLGYDIQKLFILKDGYTGWNNTYPNKIAKEISPSLKGTFKVNLNKKFFIDYEELNKILNENKNNTTIIDVRDFDEWNAESSSPYGPNFTPRKGRINNAKHLLWTNLMNSDGTDFKSQEEITSLMEKIGVTNKNQEIVVYCFKGCRSANAFVALKNAGYHNIRNYLGSWNEWSRNMDLQIDSKRIQI
jgi:thiosulfate/3-mercaptopyruvate sulfurtransferase